MKKFESGFGYIHRAVCMLLVPKSWEILPSQLFNRRFYAFLGFYIFNFGRHSSDIKKKNLFLWETCVYIP